MNILFIYSILFILFISSKEAINKLMSVKKPCILNYVEKNKNKKQFADFFIWYLKLENSM